MNIDYDLHNMISEFVKALQGKTHEERIGYIVTLIGVFIDGETDIHLSSARPQGYYDVSKN